MKGNFENLVTLAQEIERQDREKEDYLMSSRVINMPDDHHFSINSKDFKINENAHTQIADKLSIPKKYYDYMLSVPGLRAHNVNELLKVEKGKNLVRTLDGKVRAFLSDRFKPIDNYLLFQSLFPVLQEHRDIQIIATAMTDVKMYLQITFPRQNAEVVPGDIVQNGVIITNSEVGRGAVDVSSIVWRLACKNGLVRKSMLNKYHIGRKVGEDHDDYDIFKDDTIRAEIESFKLRLRDVLSHAISEGVFNESVRLMRSAENEIIEDPTETIKTVTRRYTLTESEEKRLFNNFSYEGGKPTRWKLVNSITALAHDITDVDRQYDYECIGNDVLEAKWQVI